MVYLSRRSIILGTLYSVRYILIITYIIIVGERDIQNCHIYRKEGSIKKIEYLPISLIYGHRS